LLVPLYALIEDVTMEKNELREMLDAFLTEDDYFPELLRSQDLRNERLKVESCNIHLRQITQRKKCGLQMSWIRRMKCGGARAFNMKRFFHAPICLWEIILNASIRY